MKLVYAFHEQLRNAMQWHEDMREIAKLNDETKEIVLRAIRFATTLKGPDAKQFLSDLTDAADPYRRIDNDYTVEVESMTLNDELQQSQRKFEQLTLFSQEYLKDLQTRAAQAQYRAEHVRAERERQLEENKKMGLLPFPTPGEDKPKPKGKRANG